jgi:hypothetical protein
VKSFQGGAGKLGCVLSYCVEKAVLLAGEQQCTDGVEAGVFGLGECHVGEDGVEVELAAELGAGLELEAVEDAAGLAHGLAHGLACGLAHQPRA